MECRSCNVIQDEGILCEECNDKFFKWIHLENKNYFYPPSDCKLCGNRKILHKAHNYENICIDCLRDKFCNKYQKGEIDAIENKEAS